MRIIHVLRKPLSEGTVASNVLKHGCGGLNIDASRIGNSTRTNASKASAERTGFIKGFVGGTEVAHNYGRWPANVLLQHLDGCRCDGVKRVKGSFLNHECTDGDLYGKYASVRKRGHTDKDGKETVANWICEPGCSVARLDKQSGVSTSTGGTRRAGKFAGLYGEFSGENPGSSAGGLGDTGGASRFYKQVGGKSDG